MTKPLREKLTEILEEIAPYKEPEEIYLYGKAILSLFLEVVPKETNGCKYCGRGIEQRTTP